MQHQPERCAGSRGLRQPLLDHGDRDHDGLCLLQRRRYYAAAEPSVRQRSCPVELGVNGLKVPEHMVCAVPAEANR